MSKHSVDVVVRARDQASRKFKHIGGAASGMSRMLKTAAVAAGAAFGFAAIVKGAKSLISVASIAEETNSKFQAVFKEQAAAAEAFGKDLSKSVGRSKIELKSYLATLQDTFVPLGFARDAARGMSQQMVKLAIDMASFNNTSDADAIRDLQSAIVGNHETMRKYGVIITQATLNAELLEMGFAGGATKATEQAKAQARLNIIMKGTTDAQGDAERTAGSFANQMKALKSEIKDGAASLGGGMLPAITKFVGWVRAKMKEWVENMITGFTLVEVAVKNWKDVFGISFKWAKLHLIGFVEDIKHFFGAVVPEVLMWVVRNWKDILKTYFDFLVNFWKNVGKNFANLAIAIKDFVTGKGWNFEWTGLLDGFESSIKEMPNIIKRELTDSEKDLQKDIGAMGSDLAGKFNQKLLERLGLMDTAAGGAGPGASAGDPAGAVAGGAVAGGKVKQNKWSATESRFMTSVAGATYNKVDEATISTAQAAKQRNETLKQMLTESKQLRSDIRAMMGRGPELRASNLA